ncbi:MAG: hypothetical protein ABL974_09380 [Prosthecobacter sp.]
MTEVDAGARLLDLLQTMRGFPPLQIFLLGLAFCLLAVPLSQLTGNVAQVKAAPVMAKAGDVPVKSAAVIRLRYAHKPLSISLKQGGLELLTKLDFTSSPAEEQTSMTISKAGNELELTATWPPGTPDTALTLEVEPDGLETRSETRWSDDATLNEIITFLWP